MPSDRSPVRRTLPASFPWHDLFVREPDAAGAFYAAWLGWEVRALDLGELGRAARFAEGGAELAGLVGLGEDALPARWMPYLEVDDVARACARAVERRGRVRYGPAELGGSGFAVLVDPLGAELSLIDRPPRRGPSVFDDVLVTPRPEESRAFYAELGVEVPVRPGPRAAWVVRVRVPDASVARDRALELGAVPGDEPDSLVDPAGAPVALAPAALPAQP